MPNRLLYRDHVVSLAIDLCNLKGILDKADVANILGDACEYLDVQNPDEYDMDEYGDWLTRVYDGLAPTTIITDAEEQ